MAPRQIERGQPANAARTHQQSRRGWVGGSRRRPSILTGRADLCGTGRGRLAWEGVGDPLGSRKRAQPHLLLNAAAATRCSCCSSRILADHARAPADHLDEVVTLRERARRRSACDMVCACGEDEAPVSQAWAARTRLGQASRPPECTLKFKQVNGWNSSWDPGNSSECPFGGSLSPRNSNIAIPGAIPKQTGRQRARNSRNSETWNFWSYFPD